MERELLFRGRQKGGKEWFEGDLSYLVHDKLRCYIFPPDGYNSPDYYEVDPETVGQYVGMPDKNGKKVFEGDIIATPKYGVNDGKGRNYSGEDKFAVGYSNGTYTLENGRRRFCLRLDVDAMVIGNIYDNPELLEVEKWRKFRDPETGKVFESIDEAFLNHCNSISTSQCLAHECPLDVKSHGNGGCRRWADEHPDEAVLRMGYAVIEEKEDDMDKQDKPLSEWTLGEAKAECRGRDDCSQCPLYGYTCAIGESDPAQIPSEYLLDTITPRPVDTEREGLGPSPTAEIEAPRVDVGAGSKPARPRLAEVLGVEVGEQFAIKGLARDRPIYFVDENGFLRWYEICMDNINALALAINHPERIIRTPRLTKPEIAIMRSVGAKWVSRDDDPNNNYVDLWDKKPEKFVDTYGSKGFDALASVRTDSFPSVKPGECIGLEETET